MGFLATLLSFLRALPTLIILIREIWGALSEFYEAYNRREQAKRLKDAIKLARETKDTSAIENFFNPPKPTAAGEQVVQEPKT